MSRPSLDPISLKLSLQRHHKSIHSYLGGGGGTGDEG